MRPLAVFRRVRSTPCCSAIFRASGEAFTSRAADAGAADAIAAGASAVLGAATGAGAAPGSKISAIVRPTGTTSPGCADTSPSTPDAGASISTLILSVSISTIDSPLFTRSPGDLIQRRTLPVSCAISSAGMMTFVGIALGDSTADPRLQLGRGGGEADAGRAGPVEHLA